MSSLAERLAEANELRELARRLLTLEPYDTGRNATITALRDATASMRRVLEVQR